MNSNELVGRKLGTCTLQHLLGRGGMGVVYLAQQSRPKRTVAVKVLMPSGLTEEKQRTEFLARFRREADAVAALDHVQIMPIYEYGEEDDFAYLVMPYLPGGTLKQALEEHGPFTPAEVAPILEQASAALDFAHSQGIIHRDLKPGNIIFHADGRLLLADFGLAKMINESPDGENLQSTLTNAGTIIGTPEYLSPEQGTGKKVDHHTDIYSLGVVIFHMLAGRPPFLGSSAVAVAIKHAMEAPPSLCALNPNIPPAIEAVVFKALAKETQNRFHSAGAFAQAFINAIPGQRPASVVATQQTPAEEHTILEVNSFAQEETSIAPPKNRFAAPTEANPVLDPRRPEPAPIPPLTPAIGYVPNTPEPINPHTFTQRPGQNWSKLVAPVQPQQPKRSPLPFVLLTIFLVLIVASGGIAWSLGLFQPSNPNQANNQATPTMSQTTATAPVEETPTPAPNALIPSGSLIYGLHTPGCAEKDFWKLNSVQLSCSKDGTEIKGSKAISSLLFDSISYPQKLPTNYIVQAVFNLDDSQGTFGLVAHAPLDNQAGVYLTINKNGHFTTSALKPNGSTDFVILEGSFVERGNVTVDILAQGSNYKFYINGKEISHGYSYADYLSDGVAGIVFDQSTKVVVRSFAIYNAN